MKKLFPLFTDHTSLNGRTTTLLGCTNPEFNTQNVSNGNCISTQKIENFLKNDQRLLAGVGVGGGENNDHVINDVGNGNKIPEVAVSSSVNNDKESNKTTATAAKRKNQKANGAAGGGKSQKNIILKQEI